MITAYVTDMSKRSEIELLQEQLRQSLEREKSLLAQIKKLTDQVNRFTDQLKSHVITHEAEISALKAENIDLRERLFRFEHPPKRQP